MVLEISHDLDGDGDLDIRGSVAGSHGAAYSVYVSVGQGGAAAWVYSGCSCPVAEGCKHAVELLLVVRHEHEQQHAADGVPGSRRWERRLASVLDELDAAAGRVGSATAKPLALQVDVN